MSTETQSSAPKFRIGQLIYDTRYRAKTIQVIAGFIILSSIWWLGANIAGNLSALGKDFNLAFLSNPAGYDINQKLIEYDSKMSHGRAALVGIMNTLLVSVLGCIAATFIGVFVGVLRLSDNWVINRLAAVYVEAFRSVPLLLWIVFIFAILSEALPQPRDFRGEDATASMQFFDSVAITARGAYVPRVAFTNSLSGNEPVTVRDSTAEVASGGVDWALIFGVLLLGSLAAYWLKQRADSLQSRTGQRPLTLPLQIMVVVVPTALMLWFLGATMVQPYLKGFNFTEGTFIRKSLLALWLALSLYTGAFIAEIVRGGIMSVDNGQREAALALGLRPDKVMRLIILPQAMRVIIPPLISNYLSLAKNSSLALAVGYMDVRATLGGITINQTGRELEAMLLLGLFYLVLSLLIAGVINLYDRSKQIQER